MFHTATVQYSSVLQVVIHMCSSCTRFYRPTSCFLVSFVFLFCWLLCWSLFTPASLSVAVRFSNGFPVCKCRSLPFSNGSSLPFFNGSLLWFSNSWSPPPVCKGSSPPVCNGWPLLVPYSSENKNKINNLLNHDLSRNMQCQQVKMYLYLPFSLCSIEPVLKLLIFLEWLTQQFESCIGNFFKHFRKHFCT